MQRDEMVKEFGAREWEMKWFHFFIPWPQIPLPGLVSCLRQLQRWIAQNKRFYAKLEAEARTHQTLADALIQFLVSNCTSVKRAKFWAMPKLFQFKRPDLAAARLFHTARFCGHPRHNSVNT